MIKELHRMAVFVEVVEHGSFSKAATALGLGKSIVSAHVAALEKRIGTQLLTRSTRALALTQEGSVFYENCRRMEDALIEAMVHNRPMSWLPRRPAPPVCSSQGPTPVRVSRPRACRG